jgi:GTPase
MGRSPTVAIIGRPNTGKSTLFNRLVGRRKAIVSDIPGTTRDQVAHSITTPQLDYMLIDTGGMGGGSADHDLEDDVARQSQLAMETADLILFTVNGQEDLTASDFEIAKLLRTDRKSHVPVILVITKCDHPDIDLSPYYSLGISQEMIPVSAVHKLGIDRLQETITQKLFNLNFEPKNANRSPLTANRLPHIALIGKTNVGKSSIINALLSDPKLEKLQHIVSDIPGTTRDATDSVIRHNDKEYLFIDTAGIKQNKGVKGILEYFANIRSIQALEHADIAVLVLDTTQPITRQDKRIAQLAVQEGKGLILLANKIDALSTEQKTEALEHIKRELSFCRFAPVLPCSAHTREELLKLFELIENVITNRQRHIATKDLHLWYAQSIANQSMHELSRSKHITQADETPPTFVLFVKDPKRVRASELKYLENRLRSTFALEGTPVRWITKAS